MTISLVGAILIGFPAELFNRTLRANYDRLRRLFPWIGVGGPPSSQASQFIALFLSTILAGLLATLQKLHDWSPNAAITVAAAIACGFLVTTIVYELATAAAAARLAMPPRYFRAYPGALPLVGLFVAVSTLGNFQPAYIYGHLASYRPVDDKVFSSKPYALQTLVGSSALLVLAFLSWVLRAVVTESPGTDLLGGITIVALNRLVLGLIPVTFFEGLALYTYSRLAWIAIYAPSVTAFLLLVLLPVAQLDPAGPIGVSVALFVIFAGLSIGLWVWFRRPSAREQPRWVGG